MRLPLLLDTVNIVYRNGEYVDGIWEEGSDSESEPIKSNVQRCTPQEIMRLPEGFRSQEVLKVFIPRSTTVDLLLNPDQGDNITVPSFVIYKGNTYAIISSEKWDHLLPHWKLTVVDRNPV